MSELWPQLVESLRLDLLLHLVLAVVFGGVIGFERERRGKPAGLRTNVLICVGATLFTELSISMAGAVGDPGRVAAQIVTGVGFLGAGTILHSRGYITGLTSAATIWLVAAIGMAIGTDAVLEAAGATFLVVVVLRFLARLERRLARRQETSRVVVEVSSDPNDVHEVEEAVRKAGVEIQEMHSERMQDKTVVELVMRGPLSCQEVAKASLLRMAGSYTAAVEE
jgi:putative Mg2+ transporter-C (MgtC) family protein